MESRDQSMPASTQPEMSVVVVPPDAYATVRKSIQHLRAQQNPNQLEIILVAPSAAHVAIDETELKDFNRFSIVEVGDMSSTARARVAGVHAASAEIVAFVEDHPFPAPGWA